MSRCPERNHCLRVLLTLILIYVAGSGCAAVGRFIFGEREFRNPAVVPLPGSPAREIDLSGAQAELGPEDRPAAERRVTILDTSLLSEVSVGELASGATLTALAVSRDGLSAFAGASDGSVFLAELAPGRGRTGAGTVRVRTLAEGEKPVLALAASPNGRFLAIAKFSLVSVLDLTRMKVVFQMSRVSGRILSLAWDPRGELLAMGRANGDIFVWNLVNGPAAGQDSSDALETYEGADAPVLHLAFHPSSRAFFSGSQNGAILLWRLLRTERELGLRDEWADVDKQKRGTKLIVVGRVPGRVEDMFLDAPGGELLAASQNGSIYRWQIRGLRARDEIPVGGDSVGSFRLIHPHLIVTTGRGQRIRLFCRNEQAEEVGGKVPIIRSEESVAAQSGGPLEVIDGELQIDRSAERATPLPGPAKPAPDPVATSRLLAEPLGIVRGGEQADVLWATEKTGSLVLFAARSLVRSATGRALLERCARSA